MSPILGLEDKVLIFGLAADFQKAVGFFENRPES